MPHTKAFWSKYRAVVAMLLEEPLGPNDGVFEAEVTRAEARLGIRFPRLLREMYLHTATRGDIHTAHGYLIHLDELEIRDQDLLVFYHSHSYGLRGVDINDLSNDPAVYHPENETCTLWETHTNLSEFFLNQLLHQLFRYGLAFHGRTKLPDWGLTDGALPLSPDWKQINDGDGCQLEFIRRRQFIIVDFCEREIHGAARTQTDYKAMTRNIEGIWTRYTPEPTQPPATVADVVRRKQEKAYSPWGEAVCDKCKQRKRTWADTKAGKCGYCGYPLGPVPVGVAPDFYLRFPRFW